MISTIQIYNALTVNTNIVIYQQNKEGNKVRKPTDIYRIDSEGSSRSEIFNVASKYQ